VSCFSIITNHHYSFAVEWWLSQAEVQEKLKLQSQDDVKTGMKQRLGHSSCTVVCCSDVKIIVIIQLNMWQSVPCMARLELELGACYCCRYSMGYLFVGHDRDACKNGWTDWDAVWGRLAPSYHVLDGCDLWIIVCNCCSNQMNLFLEIDYQTWHQLFLSPSFLIPHLDTAAFLDVGCTAPASIHLAFVGPIPSGHSGPVCHALSLSSLL